MVGSFSPARRLAWSPVSLRPSSHDELLRFTRSWVIDHLASLTHGVVAKTDEWLVEEIQQEADTYDPYSPSPRREALNVLRSRGPTIEQELVRHYHGLFDDVGKNEPPSGYARQLSLMGEHELRQQLVSDLIVEALRRAHGHSLAALGRGLAKVVGASSLTDLNNPLSAVSFGHAMHGAVHAMELPVALQVVLYKVFERELYMRFPKILGPLMERFADAGLVPRAPMAFQRSQLAQVGNPAPAAAEGGNPGTEGSDDATLLGELREMLRSLRPQSESPSQSPDKPGDELAVQDERRALHIDEMLSLLSLMQGEVPPALREALEGSEAPLSALLKRDLLDSARRIGLSPERTRMSPEQEDAVDLVCMLFDVLLDENDFDPRSSALVSRLVVPYVKVALLDRQKFLHRSHPARRLLNALTQACEGNTGKGPREREVLARAERVVETVVTDFNDDVAIFETLESALRAFLDQQQKRIELAERRGAEAQRGRERLEQARLQAHDAFAKRVDGRDTPPALGEFLARAWSHHLSMVALRQGTDAPEWASSLSLADGLLDLLPGGRSADVPLQSAREAHDADLRTVLASIGVNGDAADAVITAIMDGIDAQRRDEAHSEAPAVSMPRAPAVSATVADTPHRSRADSAATAASPIDDDLEALRHLQVGDWISLAGDSEKMAPAKLTFVSPISNRMMFVNRRGVRVLLASVDELGALMRSGRLALRGDEGGTFEDALQRVVERLKQDIA
jgi:hypothetical protein